MNLRYLAFFILLYTNAFSQQKPALSYENAPLEQVLKALEDKYDIKFSFNSSIVNEKKITIDKKKSLWEFLDFIQNKTSLLFEKINERYYAIKNKPQTKICGYLITSSKEPIVDSFIFNTTNAVATKSNSRGFFQLTDTQPQDTLLIQSIGLEEHKILAQELFTKGCPKITIATDDVELEEVTITEYITAGISKVGLSNAIHLNPSELGILPRLVEPDVLQSLQAIPGVQSPSETAAGLHIRGGTPDQNLILWDGIKMYSTGHFFDLLSIFNPHITDNVTLYRSSTEAKYGNRISGVIDIQSKDELVKDFGIGLGFNMTNADIFIEAPINKHMSFIVSARRSFTDVVETSTFQSYSERAFQSIRFFIDNQELDQETLDYKNVFFFNDLTLKMTVEPSPTDKLTLSAIFTNNNLDYSLKIRNILGSGEPFDEIQRDQLKFLNQGVNARWKKKWNDHLSHTINLYHSTYNFSYRGLRESRASRDGFLFFQDNISENNDIRDFGASLHTLWNFKPKHSISTGYDFATNNVSYNADYTASGFSDLETGNNITHAVFASYDYTVSDLLKLTTGLRANYFSVTNKELYLEPRFSLEYKITKGITAKLAAERKHQVISQRNNFLPYDFNIDNQVWLLANSDSVWPLRSDQLSGGFVLKKGSWYLDIEGYYKTIDGITSFASGFNGVLDLDQGQSTTSGLDILLKKRIQNYRTWISYSITDQKTQFDSVNNGTPFRGNFDINHYFSWTHTYQWRQLEVSLGWNIRTGRPFTPANGVTETNDAVFINFGDVNSSRLATYHRLDAAASYSFSFHKNKKWKGKIGISFFNLYNQRNILNRTYDIRFDNNNRNYLLQEINTFSAGMTPNLSFRVSF